MRLTSLCTVSQNARHTFQCNLLLLLAVLVALLSGARNHRQSDLARNLYDRMRSLFPHARDDLIAASILVSNTYSSIGDYDQALAIRNDRLQRHGRKVTPGITRTEVNGEVEVSVHLMSHIVDTRRHSYLVCVAGVQGTRQPTSACERHPSGDRAHGARLACRRASVRLHLGHASTRRKREHRVGAVWAQREVGTRLQLHPYAGASRDRDVKESARVRRLSYVIFVHRLADDS